MWYFLMASTIAGMALLAPLVHKEIFNHEDVRQRRKNEPSAVTAAFDRHHVSSQVPSAALKSGRRPGKLGFFRRAIITGILI